MNRPLASLSMVCVAASLAWSGCATTGSVKRAQAASSAAAK